MKKSKLLERVFKALAETDEHYVLYRWALTHKSTFIRRAGIKAKAYCVVIFDRVMTNAS